MDEVHKRNFKSPTGISHSDDVDHLSLFIRQIPVEVTRDEFFSLMIGNYGRRVTNVYLNRKFPPNAPFTYGFAYFASFEEALDAYHEFNDTPPLYLEVIFARKKIENGGKVHPNFPNMQNTSRGRGSSITPIEPEFEMDARTPNTHMSSKGRAVILPYKQKHIRVKGAKFSFRLKNFKLSATKKDKISVDTKLYTKWIRIDLEGQKSLSSKLKVTAVADGRKVSVGSSSKQNCLEVNGQFSNDESPSLRSVKSPENPARKKKDEITPLIANPFLFCFTCGKEGHFSCIYCKKPYCCRRCQIGDLLHNPDVCNKAQKIAEKLLDYFNDSQIKGNDSSYMSESSNSDHEKEKANPTSAIVNKSSPNEAVSKKSDEDGLTIEKLSLNSGQVEKVSVISDSIKSPSRFCLRLHKFSQDFVNMERKLTSFQKDLAHFENASLICPQLHLCALCNGKMCRAAVIRVKSQNEIFIYLLDYGKTASVQKSALFKLPTEFKRLPAQAVTCRLVGAAGNETIEWNSEDNLSFQLHTSDKNYKAHFYRCNKNAYDVSLIDEDGVSLYTILNEAKDTETKVTKSMDTETDGPPPSIWLKLKPGIKMTLVPSILKGDCFWCYLSADGGSDLGVIMEMEKLLLNYSGKDIALSAEEGDFVAGYSKEYKQYCRCIILKRKRDSFQVRFIDYGNEEEITCLKSLSSQLYGKCCHIVKCEKPSSLTVGEFQSLFESERQISIHQVNKNSAVLSFNCSKQYSITCYPCYSHSEFEDEGVNEVLAVNEVQSVERNNSISKPQTTSTAVVNYKVIANEITTPKVLSLTEMYSVKILFIKTVSELYIQLVEDEDKMLKMVTNLNSFCSSRNSGYIPNIGEIVSCKFSDGVWYRGQVKEKINQKYRIFFIDYGNEDIVLEKNIQFLPENFRSTQFSICVSLSDIRNEDVSKSLLSKLVEEEWDMKIINEKKVPIEVMLLQKGCPLTKMIQKQTSKRSKSELKFQKLLAETTIKICFEDDKYVYVNQEKDIASLEEMTARLNSLSGLSVPKKPEINDVYCGLFDDGSWYRVTIEEEMSAEKYKVFFIDFGNYANISLCDLRDLPDDFFALPVYCTPVVFENRKELTLTLEDMYAVKVIGMQGDVQKVKIVKTENSVVSQGQIKSEGKSKECLSFKSLSTEEPVEVKICHQDDKYIYVHQAKDLPIVEDLFIKMNSTSELPVVVKPNVNNVYCGLFSDSAWYRVSVEEIVSSNSYKVYFLDYGNYETLTTTNLRELSSELSSIPVCCIPVIFENRNDITLSLDKVYTVSVVGMQEDVQKVKLIEPALNKPSELKTKTIDKNEHLLKFQKLPSDVPVDVKVCHGDESYLYFHQVKDLKTLEDMSVKLFSLSNSPSVKKPIVERIYCGLFTDDLWYRVSVKEVVSANTFKVLFLDFGNIDILSCDSLRELPDTFFEIPVLSLPAVVENRGELEFSMEEHYTVQVTGMQGKYQTVKFLLPEEAIKVPHISAIKKQRLEDGLNEVVPCFMEGEMMFCQLSSDGDRVKSLFKTLQQCGREGQVPSSISVGDVVCVQSSDSFWYRACVLSDKKAPSYKVLFFDYGNSEFITGDCIKILPHTLLEFPIFAMPMKIDNLAKITDNSIFTEPMLVKKIKVLEDEKYLVEVQIEADSNLPKISDLKVITLPSNSISNVTICNIEDNIYYVQPTFNIDKLAELLGKLSKADMFRNLSDTPVKDDVICAKYSDGVWYRCVVQEVQTDKLKVCFVDYGNSDLVTLENSRILPDDCCSYAIACVPAKFKDDAAVLNKLSEGITSFNVKVCSVSDNVQVLDIVPETEVSKKPPNGPSVSVSYDPVLLSSLEKSSLPLLKPCKVVFKHHLDNLFIVVKAGDTPAIENLNKLIEKSKTDAVSHLISVNEILLGKSKDNLWHRCCVLEADTAKNMFKVYFVDLGITEYVQKSSLRYLPENCKSFAQLAIKVSIEPERPVILEKCYIIEAVKQNADGIYSVKLSEQFMISSLSRKELHPGQVYQVMFCHKEKEKLFLQDTTDVESVIQIQNVLLDCLSNSFIPYEPEVGELVCAKSALDNSWYRGSIEEVLSADKYNIFFIDYGNCEIVQRSQLQRFPVTLTKFPSLCVPVKLTDEKIMESIEFERIYSVTAESKMSGNVQIVKLIETSNDEKNKGTNSVESVCPERSLNPPQKYQKFFFTSCKHVPFNSGEQDIAIYNVDEEGYLFCAPYDTENIAANLSLPAQLTEYCNSKGIPFKGCEPEQNEMVLALFPEDNNWYRATVIDKSHPTYDVNFVDYGNTESLDISNLRVMEEQFMKLEIQAHMCSLTGHAVPAENMGKVYEELKQFIIFSNPEPLKAHVQIIDGEFTAFIPEITSLLVKKNLATAVDKK